MTTGKFHSLFNLAKAFSRDILQRYALTTSVAVRDVRMPEIGRFPLASRIIIGSDLLELVLQMHFDPRVALEFAKRRGDGSAGSEELGKDFVREICNVVSGKLKAVIETADVALSQGLPFVFRYAVATDDRQPLHRDYWILKTAESFEMACGLLIEVKDPAVERKLAAITDTAAQSDAADTGDIELF